MRRKLQIAAKKDTRLEQLKALSIILAKAIDGGQENQAGLAPLAKQYRETLREIDDIQSTDDEIDNILEICNMNRARRLRPGAGGIEDQKDDLQSLQRTEKAADDPSGQDIEEE